MLDIPQLKAKVLEVIREDSMRPEVKGIDGIRACRIVRENSGASLSQALEFIRPLMDVVRNEKFPNEVN